MATDEAGLLRLSCPICLGYHATQSMRTLQCGHLFCEQSILKHWLSQRRACSTRPLTCPTCKGPAEQSRRRILLESGFRDEDASAKFKLLLRRVYIEDACYAAQGDQRETVYPGDPGVSSQLPVGVPGPDTRIGYSPDVLKKAKEVSARFRSIDMSINTSAVQRATEELRRMMDMMNWEDEDPILDLFGALHSFVAESAMNVYKMVVQKDSALRRKDEELTKAARENKELKAQAIHREEILDGALHTASQATEDLKQARYDINELQEGRDNDKRKIMYLQGLIQTAKATETRLRRRLAKYESDRQSLQAELSSVRHSAEQLKQENDDLHRQTAYPQAYSDYDGASEFIEGSSQGGLFADDIDLGTQLSNPSIPSSQRTSESADIPQPRPPKFISDWNLTSSAGRAGKRKRATEFDSHGTRAGGTKGSAVYDEGEKGGKKSPRTQLPLRMDRSGHAIGLVQLGPKVRLNKRN